MRDPLRAIARHLAQVGASTSVGARWEDNPRNIAKHYLKTWFALDLISYAAITPRRRPASVTRAAHSRPGPSLPAQYPTIRRALDRHRRGDGPAEGRPPLTPDAADQADSTRARISHVQAMGDAHGNRLRCERRTRLHIYTSTPPSLRLAPAPPPPPPNPAFTGTLALVKCVVLVCVGGHWFACAWAIQAGFADSPLQTWCLPLYLPSPSLPSSPTTATIATTQAGRVRLLLACGERQRLGVLACLGSVRGLAVLRDDDNHLDRLR